MQVQADKLLTKIRLRLGDMQKTRVSDYEVLSALNDARTMLWIALAERHSSIPRRRVSLALTDGSAPLPEDYYTLVSLSPGAAVAGDRVEGAAGTAEIVYNAAPPPVRDPAEWLETPWSLILDTVEIAAAIAEGKADAAAQTALASAGRVAQKREYAGIPDMRHFS